MKNLLIVVSCLFCMQQSQAQAPFYMLFDSTCMDQLLYKLSSNGATVKAFGLHAGNNEQYLLRTGDATENMTALPKGTMVCGKFILGEELMQAVNLKLRPVYLLFPTSSGYSTLPVTVISHFKRTGKIINVKSDKYSFALDTSRLSLEQNLATGDSKTKVFFKDVQPVLCRERFSYRLEPVLKADAAYKADIEYIPGIGITKMKYTNADGKQEVQTLDLINGETLGKHLGKLCQKASKKPVENTTVKPKDIP